MYKRFIKALLSAFMAMLLFATVASAAWDFLFPITVVDTSNTTRNYYPVVLGFGGQTLVDAGLVAANGTDTNMQVGSANISYMMSTTNVTAVIPTLPSGGLVTTNLYTGYTPAQSGFPIITGSGGYVTVSDNVDMEIGDNFTIESVGWVDIDSGANKNLVYKQAAFKSYISGSGNITVKALKRRVPNDIDNMRVISSVQRAFNPPQYNLTQGKRKVAVYLTSFQPFTSAQMTNIEQIHNQWNVPILLAAVCNEGNIKGNDFHLSDGVVLSQMKSMSNFNKNLIPSYMMLNTWSLREIFQFARPHYEPLIVITDTGKKSEMALQLFYEEEIMGGKINVLDEFNIGEMVNNESISAYRAIEDGNGVYFMEQTPKSIHNFYDTNS